MWIVEYWTESLTWAPYSNIKPNVSKVKVQDQVKRYRRLGAGTLRIRKVG